VDANGDEQEHGMLQVYVDGRAGHLPDPPSEQSTPFASGVGRAVTEAADRTRCVVESRRD
jgi:hypothetical protein